MAATSSSTPLFGVREEDGKQVKQQQQQTSMTPTPTSSTAPTRAPQKKKRNLPGTPYPDAEVIALSPKTLMATNRFICEVCNKGFQREQNLQLHRRGHNLPWKLKQKSTKEVKRKVYLCPEPSCVHHDPSRALGDLTGIKKHFSRKHGEKKWKCDKCSKRYAVQSDWKAHSKTCGTREYRCDCGTLFSRRDSFITHRAFCDALAQESARRLPTGLNTLGGPQLGPQLYGPTTNTGLGLSQVGHHLSPLQADPHLPSDLLRLGGAAVSYQFDHLLAPAPSSSAAFRPPYHHPSASAFFINSGGHSSGFHDDHGYNAGADSLKPFHGILPQADLSGATSGTGLFNMNFFSNTTTATSPAGPLLINDNLSGSETSTTLFSGAVMADHHLGASLYTSELPLPQMSATALLQKAAQMGATTSMRSSFGGSTAGATGAASKPDHLQDLMHSLANGGSSHVFMGGSDGMTTRDFLGVGSGMVRAGVNGGGTAMADHHIGLDMSSLDSDMKSKAGGLRPFGGASLH